MHTNADNLLSFFTMCENVQNIQDTGIILPIFDIYTNTYYCNQRIQSAVPSILNIAQYRNHDVHDLLTAMHAFNMQYVQPSFFNNVRYHSQPVSKNAFTSNADIPNFNLRSINLPLVNVQPDPLPVEMAAVAPTMFTIRDLPIPMYVPTQDVPITLNCDPAPTTVIAKYCNKQQTAPTKTTTVVTSGNDPSISKKMRYSQYVRNAKPRRYVPPPAHQIIPIHNVQSQLQYKTMYYNGRLVVLPIDSVYNTSATYYNAKSNTIDHAQQKVFDLSNGIIFRA
jgi:hypothetical protein